jgi:hypothetical protein
MADGPLGQGMQYRVLGAALVMSLTACVVEGSVSAGAGVAVAGPPPQAVQESPPAPPPTPSVWVAGYWHWTGMRYSWIPGHWERAPSGAAWHPPRYWSRDGTYYYEPGGWAPAAR